MACLETVGRSVKRSPAATNFSIISSSFYFCFLLPRFLFLRRYGHSWTRRVADLIISYGTSTLWARHFLRKPRKRQGTKLCASAVTHSDSSRIYLICNCRCAAFRPRRTSLSLQLTLFSWIYQNTFKRVWLTRRMWIRVRKVHADEKKFLRQTRLKIFSYVT